MKTTIAAALVHFALTPFTPLAQAQHTGGHGAAGSHAHTAGPYAGMQSRTIKALSEQQLADLRAGKGMSLALPAELNGYPGPAHALELASPLALGSAQKARTQALFEEMQTEARRVGEEVIAAETTLETLFKQRTATAASLDQATASAAAAHGRLRATHLRYHLVMMEVLTPEQVATYNRLRGY